MPEFGPITEHEDGTLSAVHQRSGETITARTRATLESKAVAKRIVHSLREGAR